MSSPFTVDSDAQTMAFDLAGGASTYNITIDVRYGAGYASSSTKSLSCSSGCSSWQTREIDAAPWRGQSIKLELRWNGGASLVDNVAVESQRLVGWSPADGMKVTRNTGGPDGAFATTSTVLTSNAFSVDSGTQNGEIDVKVEAAGSLGYDVKVLSGATYSTSTTVYKGSAGDTSWSTRTFGLGHTFGLGTTLQPRQKVRDLVWLRSGSAMDVTGARQARGGRAFRLLFPFSRKKRIP